MFAVVLSLFAMCFPLSSARMAYDLTHGAEDILSQGSFSQTFSCQNLPYGYYADVDNACQIFHICLPVTNGQGNLVDTFHFSFVCPNQTLFSQDSLTCAHREDAFPCDQASTLYELSNAEFGVIPGEDY
ncbi:UNVERIFIED_CONTAM: hypothetical protein GTU68_063784 [Idotea baltica]|nr:hypothetical protein [Idotea baltica]